MTTNIEAYFTDGCMRCELGGTPLCKVQKWVPELQLLRQIVLQTELKEEMKWGVPVYSVNGKNVVTVNALKDSANLGFFKGVLLKDKYKILQQQGSLQSDRLMKFTHVDEIVEIKDVIRDYVLEAIELEKKGEKVTFNKTPLAMPDELLLAFDEDQSFKEAFDKLTPGRQRGYIYYFSQPKQSKTKVSRINKCRSRIIDGLGLNDR